MQRTSDKPLVTTQFFLITAMLITAAPSALPGADAPAQLSVEQIAFTERAIAFMDEMETLYFGRIAELNGTDTIEMLDFTTEFAAHNVRVARGMVVEKAGRMRAVPKKPKADFQRQRLWSRFFSVDVHPKSPKVGMLHAAFTLNYSPDGSSAIGGWVDVLPGATPAEDLAMLKATMDRVYERYGVDPEPHRKMSCEGTGGEVSARRRKPACVGGSFYGRDMMVINDRNFRFMTEAYREFLVAYLDLIEKNKDLPYRPEDLAKQDFMRRNWLEDRFYSDPYTGNVVPYEVWSLSTLPPEVKF